MHIPSTIEPLYEPHLHLRLSDCLAQMTCTWKLLLSYNGASKALYANHFLTVQKIQNKNI